MRNATITMGLKKTTATTTATWKWNIDRESEQERMFQMKLFCRGHRDPPVDGVTGGSRKNYATLM